MVIILTGLPGKIKRIEGNTVPAEAGAGVKRLKTVRLCLGGFNHFPNIDPHAVADNSHLVGKANIDIAVSVFKQFFHLSHSWRRNFIDTARQDAAVKHRSHFGGIRAHAAHDFRRIFRLILLIARIHTFRRKSKIKIFAALQAGRFQNWLQKLFRCARIGGGFQNYKHSPVCIFCYRLGRVFHIADIRLLIFVQRRRDTDSNGIYTADKRKIGSRRKPAAFHHLFKSIADDISNIIVTGIYGLDFFVLYIKADGFIAGFCKFHRKRQPHVTQAHNADNGGFVFDFTQ